MGFPTNIYQCSDEIYTHFSSIQPIDDVIRYMCDWYSTMETPI
jgi:hypothetical protein